MRGTEKYFHGHGKSESFGSENIKKKTYMEGRDRFQPECRGGTFYHGAIVKWFH